MSTSGEAMFDKLDARRREQTPQALARLALLCLFVTLWMFFAIVRMPMPRPFLVLLIVEAAFLVGYWRLVFRLPNERAIELAHYGMLAAEVVFHTTMVYFLGGVTWLGSFAYVFGLIFTNTFLDLRRGFVYTAGASLAFGALILLEAWAVIPHQSYLDQSSQRYADPQFVATTIIGALGVFFSIYLWVNWVGRQLRQERDSAVSAQDGLLLARGALERANAALEDRVAERTEELELAIAALRESEQQLNLVVETCPDLISIQEPDGRYRFVNSAFQTVLGYRVGALIGQTPRELVHPDDLDHVSAEFRAILESGLPGEATYRFRHADGRWVIMEANGQALVDGSGQRNGVVVVSRDITERRRVEEEKQRLVSLVENSSDFVGIASLEEQVLFLNDAGQRLVGLASSEEVKRTTILDYVAEEDRAEVRERILPAILQTGRWEGELRYKHFKTGRPIPVHVNAFAITDSNTGQPVALATVSRDVTQHRLAEDALRESEARFRAMAETVAAGVYIFQGTRMLYVNPFVEQITGYTRDELLQMNFWDIVHPDLQESSRARGEARLRGEDVSMRNETRIVTKDGTERWVELSAGVIEVNGQPAVLGTAFDITERKQAEAALEEAASRDPLTGLFNRRAGLTATEQLLEDARQGDGRAALLVVDIDEFKKINDLFGHEAGDDALVRFAGLLSQLAGGGVVCRLGGDEFQIALPGTDVAAAAGFGERLQAALREDLAAACSDCPPFTVSVGVTCYPQDGDTIAELSRRADEAMYAAKAAGGDRTRAWRAIGKAKAA